MQTQQNMAEHKLICENRKKLTITNIQKVDSANLSQITLFVQNSLLYIIGKNLHVDKLDVASGHIEITGEIDMIKYADKKTNFIKRIFR